MDIEYTDSKDHRLSLNNISLTSDDIFVPGDTDYLLYLITCGCHFIRISS